MTAIEDDMRAIPAILRQTHTRVAERRDTLIPFLGAPLVVFGCGSSYCVALSAAALYEDERRLPAQAILASDYAAQPG